MNALIVCSLFILLFLLALPTITQLAACFRDTPRLCGSERSNLDQVTSRKIQLARTPSHSTHSTIL
jgi:hypothetical protein